MAGLRPKMSEKRPEVCRDGAKVGDVQCEREANERVQAQREQGDKRGAEVSNVTSEAQIP